MQDKYRDRFPKELVTHVTSMCGAAGAKWFDELPCVITVLEKRWSITVEAPFPGVEYNFVAPASTKNGDRVAIKISPPFEIIEIFGEARYLRERNGRGAIRLLDIDTDCRAILLEHANPGQTLPELFTGREEAAIGPAIDVLGNVLAPPPDDRAGIVNLDDWFDGLIKAEAAGFAPSYVKKALDLYERLSRRADASYYLHGDYHPGNIVNSDRGPFLAIDPKGIIGYLGYEIAVFLINCERWINASANKRQRIDSMIDQFSRAFDISPMELNQWAFAHMVLGAWWTYDETPDLYDNEIKHADFWDM